MLTGLRDDSARDRLIVTLHLKHGYTQAQIVTHLSLHHATVSRIVSRTTHARNKTLPRVAGWDRVNAFVQVYPLSSGILNHGAWRRILFSMLSTNAVALARKPGQAGSAASALRRSSRSARLL